MAFRERNVGPAIGREEGGGQIDRPYFFTARRPATSPAVHLSCAAGVPSWTTHRVAGAAGHEVQRTGFQAARRQDTRCPSGAAARPGRRCDRHAVAAAIRWQLANARSRPGAVFASIDLSGSSGLRQPAVAGRCTPSTGHERRFGRLGCQFAVAAPQAASGMGAISASMLRARCFSISRSMSPLRSAVAGAPVVLAARKQVARSRRRRNWS